jgi:CheY-like chemotaxis protein
MIIADAFKLPSSIFPIGLTTDVCKVIVTEKQTAHLVGCISRSYTTRVDSRSNYNLEGFDKSLDEIMDNSSHDNAGEAKNAIKSGFLNVRSEYQSFKRILIVDDEPDIIFTLKSVFEGHPTRFQIASYASPVEALSTFKPNYYDLALIDINMPIMNGFQLCEKLVDLDSNIRVCFLSGGEMNQEAIREIYPRISLGCFIKKPVGANELIERVNSQLD